MAKYENGGWMGLFTDGEPLNFIKGHVSHQEAQEIALKALREQHNDPNLIVEVNHINHLNGRFGIGYDECGERISWLYLHRPLDERGSFPVTEVQYTVDIWS